MQNNSTLVDVDTYEPVIELLYFNKGDMSTIYNVQPYSCLSEESKKQITQLFIMWRSLDNVVQNQKDNLTLT